MKSRGPDNLLTINFEVNLNSVRAYVLEDFEKKFSRSSFDRYLIPNKKEF